MRMLISERFPGSAWFNSKTVKKKLLSQVLTVFRIVFIMVTALLSLDQGSRKWEHQNEGSIRGISCCLFVRVCWSQRTGKGKSFWVVLSRINPGGLSLKTGLLKTIWISYSRMWLVAHLSSPFEVKIWNISIGSWFMKNTEARWGHYKFSQWYSTVHCGFIKSKQN